MKYKWCKKIGHKWVYSKQSTIELRACRRCGSIEEYRKNVPGFGSAWFMLTQRTKKGGEKLLKRLQEQHNE